MSMRLMLNAILTAALFASGVGLVHAQEHHRDAHRECHNVRVKNKASDNHRIAGTAIGAVAGGLLGHQIGGGKGKTLATVGGAVAGGYAGNKVQEHHQDENARYHTERRCHDERD